MDEKKKEAPAAAPAKGKEEPAKKAEKPAGTGNNNMILLAVIIVVGVLLQVLVPRIIAPAKTVHETEETEEPVTGHGVVDVNATEMGATTNETPVEIVVNIAGTDGERFLKAALVMEYVEKASTEKAAPKKEGGHGGGHGAKKEGEGEAAAGLAGAIKQRLPKYQNYLIENLSKMTMAELTAPETKEKIRKDFIHIVNSSLPANLGVVKDIYFTQYIIQ